MKKKVKIQPANIYALELEDITLGWWYLHGQLQEDIGTDQGYILNLTPEQLDFTNRTIILNGIYEVEVVGIDKPCIGFFWFNFNKVRGLVEYKDDKAGLKYARQQYTGKSMHI